MAFTIFENSTTTNPTAMNDNFLWVAQGSILPKAGVNLGYTTGINNIGTSTVTWSGLYANNLKLDSGVYDYSENRQLHSILTEINTTATTRIEVIISNTSQWSELEFITYIGTTQLTTATTLLLYLNNDSNSNLYRYISNYMNTIGVAQQIYLSYPGYYLNACICETTTGIETSFSYARITPKKDTTSSYILKIDTAYDTINTKIAPYTNIISFYTSTTNTITSFVFTFSTTPTYFFIGIYGRGWNG